MCYKKICKEFLAVTKTWSIRKQIITFYVIALLVIFSLLVCVVALNLKEIRSTTVQDFEETLDTQGTENMRALVTQGSLYLSSLIGKVTFFFEYFENILQNMFTEDTFSFDYTPSYTYNNSKGACTYIEWPNYGKNPVCFNTSIYYSLGSNIQEYSDLLDKTSRFNYFWEKVLVLTSQLALRYMLIFEDRFIVVYPGIFLEDPSTLPWWYEDYKNSTEKLYCSSPYRDTMGDPDNFIICLLYTSPSPRDS